MSLETGEPPLGWNSSLAPEGKSRRGVESGPWGAFEKESAADEVRCTPQCVLLLCADSGDFGVAAKGTPPRLMYLARRWAHEEEYELPFFSHGNCLGGALSVRRLPEWVVCGRFLSVCQTEGADSLDGAEDGLGAVEMVEETECRQDRRCPLVMLRASGEIWKCFPLNRLALQSGTNFPRAK